MEKITLLFRLCLSILYLTGFSLAQIEDEELIVFRDTSFTIYSAFNKEREKFPFIEIAKPQLRDNILIDTNVVYITY